MIYTESEWRAFLRGATLAAFNAARADKTIREREIGTPTGGELTVLAAKLDAKTLHVIRGCVSNTAVIELNNRRIQGDLRYDLDELIEETITATLDEHLPLEAYDLP